jgi:hypothetical protein
MKFIRVGDEIIRLDLVTHIKEGAKDETLYGRSVRKTADTRFGWLEVHFVSGDVIKVEGEAANVLRKILEDELMVKNLSPPMPPRKVTPHDAPAPEPSTPRHDHAARQPEEHRPGIRNGFGR